MMQIDPSLAKPIESVFAWVWNAYGSEIVQQGSKKLWEKIEWRTSANQYGQKMERLYGMVRVLGQVSPKSLEDIFTEAYILVRPLTSQKLSTKEITGKEDRIQRLPGINFIAQKEKLFIVGKPGAGKTTFLKYIVQKAIRGEINYTFTSFDKEARKKTQNDLSGFFSKILQRTPPKVFSRESKNITEHKIPIFISLRELDTSGKAILDFLLDQFDICNFPNALPFIEQLLQSGKALILFDGLDEVRDQNERRSQLIDALNNFIHKYDTNQFVVTSRVGTIEYRFSEFEHVEIADFSIEQMSTFVRNWFVNNSPKGELFISEISRGENIRLLEMGRVPLNLTMLCLTFEELGRFPRRRVEIYEEALDALLGKWDAERNIQREEIYRKLSLGRKKQMFARIAADMFEKGEYLIRQKDLEEMIVNYLEHIPPGIEKAEINGTAVLKAIEEQHGIFLQRAHGVYSFVHLTFQEYFTAKNIVENALQGTIQKNVRQHLINENWREIFLLIASMLDDARPFFDVCIAELQGILSNSIHLLELVGWAQNKVTQIVSANEESAARSYYIFSTLDLSSDEKAQRVGAQALALARDLDRDLDIEGDDLDSDIDKFLTSRLSKDDDIWSSVIRHIFFSRYKYSDFNIVFAIEFNDMTLALTRDLARDFNRTVALDITLAHIYHLINGDYSNRKRKTEWAIQWAIGDAKQLDLVELQEVLSRLIVPENNSDINSRMGFVKSVERILIEYRGIKIKWELNQQELMKFDSYLRANRLVVACLKVAYVDDRRKIKNDLLKIV